MTTAEAERLAALPAGQQRALIANLARHVNTGWDKQWGALPLDEPAPHGIDTEGTTT